MVRRRKKGPAYPASWSPWDEKWAAMFRLAPAEWTPPTRVRVFSGKGRATVQARFTEPCGSAATVTMRFKFDTCGKLQLVDEQARFKLGRVAA